MRILLASAEVHPYSKTGGLADMVSALGKSLARLGHQVGVVTPLYRSVRERFPAMKPFDWRIDLPLGGRWVSAKVWTLRPRQGLTLYFVDQPEFYQRPSLYGEGGEEYPDNAERFTFLSKCVAHLARYLSWQPEVVHAHDWHVGLAPLFVRHQARHDGWIHPPRTCLTIHNVAYQGNYPGANYALTNLPLDYFNPSGVEFYGRVNFLKAGIAYADAITAVSRRYAAEIILPGEGYGLDGILRARADALVGILNGADYDEWRTTKNPYLLYPYTGRSLGGKAKNKTALQAELGLPQRAVAPLFGAVSRLAHQKGIDIELEALEELLGEDIQFALLGSGQKEFEEAASTLASRYPSKVAVRIGYDQGLAHRIEAGADFFLMPSLYEPCGLNQMYSLRYGAIPVVRATGGLDDSIIDPREDSEMANGIKFHDYSAGALTKAIRKALALYQEPELLLRFRQNGMAAAFPWELTAEQYLRVYRGVAKKVESELRSPQN